MEHLQPAADAINANGGKAIAVVADVRQPEAVETAVAQTVEAFGKIDIVINGAAGNFLCNAEELSPNGFGTVVDIDLKGTFNVCRAAFAQLKEHRGQILNISATLHYLGTPMQLHVSAAKAGVDALTRNLAVEWGRYGIRVNAIAPGPIEDTEGMKRLVPEPIKERIQESRSARAVSGESPTLRRRRCLFVRMRRVLSMELCWWSMAVTGWRRIVRLEVRKMLDLQPSSFEAFEREARTGERGACRAIGVGAICTRRSARSCASPATRVMRFCSSRSKAANESRAIHFSARIRRWSSAARGFKRLSNAMGSHRVVSSRRD